MTQHTVLITGATDGIGLALAKAYRQRPDRLVLVGRKPLRALPAPLFSERTYCQTDLAAPERTEQILAWLDAHGIDRIDLLIHNAAQGYAGAFAQQPPDKIHDLVGVNLQAPIELTQVLYPRVHAVAGKLIFIGSVVSALPSPDYAVYTATKAALDAYVRNLRLELDAANSGVQVKMIRPGATRTGMHQKSGIPPDQINQKAFAPAEQVAEQILEAIGSSTGDSTLGLSNRAIRWTGIHLPRIIDPLIARKYQETHREEVFPSHLYTQLHNHVHAEGAGSPTRHCVITGAADGIGRALAHRFGRAGYTITGIDVDRARAMRTQADLINAGYPARFAIADIGDPQEIEKLLDILQGRPPIDVLIHNAGINAVARMGAQDARRQSQVIAVNLLGPLLLTAGVFQKNCIAHDAAHVFISSLSHFISYPGAAAYAASKDGLHSYARSLATALQGTAQHVLTVYPGPTRTAHARRYSPDNRREHRRMPPEKLADLLLKAVQKRQRTLIPGLPNRLFALAGRLAPHWTGQIMCRTILSKLPMP